MPSFERQSNRIVIAGASSLLGAELKSLLEESKFAGWDLRLVDEGLAAGILTEAGGEPAVIQPVEEGSFAGAKIVFFTGSLEFAERNLSPAQATGAMVIDLSGGARSREGSTCPWFPRLGELWGQALPSHAKSVWIISAPAVAAVSLSLGLKPLGLKKISLTCFRPVSEAGRGGIEELESQTKQLLSFQSAGQNLFETQVAFAIADRYGAASREILSARETRMRSEVLACTLGFGLQPAIRMLHVPVFYGYTFSANVELDSAAKLGEISLACTAAGFSVVEKGAMVSNLTAAGESTVQLAQPEADPALPGSWWFWGAADNIRLPAWNAVKLAEKLL